MKPVITGVALLALSLSACQQEDPNNFAIDEGNSENASIETLPPDESSLNNLETESADSNSASVDSAAAVIPAQYRGRWGMVPADCTSTRGDAKGLIEIADKTVTFFESSATLKEQRPAIATSFSGEFAFTGESQSWDKVMTFTRTGDTLKRAEESGTFTYKRCA
jgi:hypothetical protein